MYARVVVGVGKGVLFSQFRGVLIEGFHCTHKAYKMCCITNTCVHVKSIVYQFLRLCALLSLLLL